MLIDNALSTTHRYAHVAPATRPNTAAIGALPAADNGASAPRATLTPAIAGLSRTEAGRGATDQPGRSGASGASTGDTAAKNRTAHGAGTAADSGGTDAGAAADQPASPASELDPADEQALAALKQRDREVRAHEQAHLAAAGGLAKGGPSYETTRGPDGRMYATGGEVQIDASAVADDPKATIAKAQQVRRAALAPANPSSQDRQVAANAAAMEAEARAELAAERLNGGEGAASAGGSDTDASTDKPEAAGAIGGAADAQAAVCEQCGGKHSGGAHSAFNQREMDRMIVAAQPGSAPTLELRA